MSSALVQCIPNFSEGRRPQVVDAIVQAITAVPGVMLLDRHSDADHNRSLVTYAGPPQAVSEAAFAAIRKRPNSSIWISIAAWRRKRRRPAGEQA